MDLSGGHGPSDKIVQNNIEAQPRRNPVGGGRTQEHRAEAIVGKRSDVALRPYLGITIGSDRIESTCLVDQPVAGTAIVAAGRSEYESSDPCLFGKLCDSHARSMVDFVRGFRVEV